MSKRFFKQYADLIWEHDALIDGFQNYLYDALEKLADDPEFSPETTYYEFKPIWKRYRRGISRDDPALIDDGNFDGYLRRKINIIKSNSHLRDAGDKKGRGKNKTGLNNIPVFLEWLDEHHQDLAMGWFISACEFYDQVQSVHELSFVSTKEPYAQIFNGFESSLKDKPTQQSDPTSKDDAPNFLNGLEDAEKEPLKTEEIKVFQKLSDDVEPDFEVSSLSTDTVKFAIVDESEKWSLIHTWNLNEIDRFYETESALVPNRRGLLPDPGLSFVWTKDHIRAISYKYGRMPFLSSFRLGEFEGKSILFRQNEYLGVWHLTQSDTSTDTFFLSDDLGWYIIENSHEEDQIASVVSKSYHSNEVTRSDGCSGHPLSSYDRLSNYLQGIRFSTRQILCDSSGEFVVLARMPNSQAKRRDILADVFSVSENEIVQICEWRFPVLSLGSVEPHPSIPGLFFCRNGYVYSVSKGVKRLVPDSDWEFPTIIRHSVWHPVLPLIAIVCKREGQREAESIRIINVETGECAVEKKICCKVGAFDWSPTGKHIFFSDEAKNLYLWDLHSGRIDSKAFDSAINFCWFSPCGERLALHLRRKSQSAAIISAKNLELIVCFDGFFSSFSRTPWHYLGGHVSYTLDDTICVRQLT